MNAERAVAVRTQYLARPGRRVIVVTDLASLRGPSRGTVELPLRLYWSGPSPVFDLDEPYLRRWLYQIVLREASRPEDLTGYLDRDTLIAVWPQLHLPKGVRQAWEEHHPQLRAGAAGAAWWRSVICTAGSPRSPWPRRPSTASRWAAGTRCWPMGSFPGRPRMSTC